MSRLRAALIATAALAGVLVSAPAQADVIAPSPGQPFYVTAPTTCTDKATPYGYTRGALNWRPVTLPGVVNGVGVQGVVVDHPTPVESSRLCPDDGWYTYATYSAYTGRVLVDEQAARTDNAEVAVSLVLQSRSATALIDRVVIQVCRASLNGPINNATCGRPQEFGRNVIQPQS